MIYPYYVSVDVKIYCTVLRHWSQEDIKHQFIITNAEAWFNIALRPRKPEGSLGRTAQDGHHDSHTAPELCMEVGGEGDFIPIATLSPPE